MAVWQFREYHARRMAAPLADAFEAIKRLGPDEVFLCRTLIWVGPRPEAQARDAWRRAMP